MSPELSRRIAAISQTRVVLSLPVRARYERVSEWVNKEHFTDLSKFDQALIIKAEAELGITN